MRERPIIFNGEMVRAVLGGRKTQTRRIINWRGLDDGLNLQFSGLRASEEPNGWVIESNSRTSSERRCQPTPCPFGSVGDRLWVRETWQGPLFDYEKLDEYLKDRSAFENNAYCEYAADGGPKPEYFDADDNLRYGWRPSIHMPRWASRITLEVTDVRAERLQSIRRADVLGEGIIQLPASGRYCIHQGDQYFGNASHDAREVYSWLWESIYGAGSWAANPWVWVIEFQRVEGD